MSDMQMILIILIVYLMLNSKSLCNGIKENFSDYAGVSTPSLEGCKQCLNDDNWRKMQKFCEEESEEKAKTLLADYCWAKFKNGNPPVDFDKPICNSTIINENTEELEQLAFNKC